MHRRLVKSRFQCIIIMFLKAVKDQQEPSVYDDQRASAEMFARVLQDYMN